MTTQCCGVCRHFDLKNSPTRSMGFGLCTVDPNPLMRAGRTLNPQCICRLGKFEKADPKVIARREKEGATLL
jgi:hypothetical protein